ncbi:MAG: pseudouridine synthase [Pirellulales bacterium]
MPKSKRQDDRPGFMTGPQRLNKVLAAAGLGARRQVEELIEQGRVEVDGDVCTEFGKKVDPATQKIVVDGVSLKKQRPVYFAVNKPAGVLCTNRDPEGRARVVDLVPGSARLFPIGRLDRSSLGLIILTNDGELSQRLAHPKYSVPKSYFVVVQGQISAEELARLRRGIYLAEGVARVEGAKIRKVRKGCTEIDITLTEGKNREIRRVLARLGHKVVVLRRIAIASLRLGDLPEGAYRPLNSTEVAALYRAAEEARLAKKAKKQQQEDEQPTASKGKATKGAEKNTKKAASKSKPSKPTQKAYRSLDDDELLEDRFDDEWGDDEVVSNPVLDDDSEEDAEDSVEQGLFEVAPVWNDAMPASSRKQGGVIDYEEESSFSESDSEEGEDEDIIVPRKRPSRGDRSGEGARSTKGARGRSSSEKDRSRRDQTRGGNRPYEKGGRGKKGMRTSRPAEGSSEGVPVFRPDSGRGPKRSGPKVGGKPSGKRPASGGFRTKKKGFKSSGPSQGRGGKKGGPKGKKGRGGRR